MATYIALPSGKLLPGDLKEPLYKDNTHDASPLVKPSMGAFGVKNAGIFNGTVDDQYVSMKEAQLQMKEKRGKAVANFLGGDDFGIADSAGNERFRLVAPAVHLPQTRQLKDASGRVILTLRQDVVPLRNWTLYRGDSTSPDAELARISKQRPFFVKRQVDIYFKRAGPVPYSKEPDMVARAPRFNKEFTIYARVAGDEVLVASSNRPCGKALIIKTWLFGRGHYTVNVAPEVDAALVAALCNVLDAMFKGCCRGCRRGCSRTRE